MLLFGLARFLFIPLAVTVVFCDAGVLRAVVHASCRPSRASCWDHDEQAADGVRRAASAAFDRGFDRFREAYGRGLAEALARRRFVLGCAGLLIVVTGALVPRDRPRLFPHRRCRPDQAALRAPRGTRLERNRKAGAAGRGPHPRDHSGEGAATPSTTRSACRSRSTWPSCPATMSAAWTREILISLERAASPVDRLHPRIRAALPEDFPGSIFYFQTADIVSQVLNFGLSAPIDVQIQDVNFERAIATGATAARSACSKFPAWPTRTSGAGARTIRRCRSTSIDSAPPSWRVAARRRQQHADVAVVEFAGGADLFSSIRRTT